MLRLKLSPLNKRLLLTDSGGSAPLDSDYLAWKARVIQIGGSVQPDEELRINDAIVKQKADNNFEENDRQWVHCTSNINAAIVSLNNPLSNPLALINGVVFSPYEGFQGDGVTQYIDTQFNSFTDGVKYTLNSASTGVYVGTDSQSSGFELGVEFANNKTGINVRNTVNNTQSIINSVDVIFTTPNSNSIGLFQVVRFNNSLSSLYKNGVEYPTNAVSSSIPNGNIFLLCTNLGGTPNNFSNRLISFSSAGSGAIEQASFYDSIKPLVDGAETELYKGLIAGYNLDGDATSATGQYNGTPTNVSWVTGKKGLAASFINSSKIDLGNLLPSSNGSLSYWLKPQTGTSDFQVYRDTNGGYFRNTYYESLNILEFVFFTPSEKVISTNNNILINEWVSIFVTWNSTNFTIYVNGIFYNTILMNGSLSGYGDISLNSPNTFTNASFLLDMVGFWNRPLTQEEITILYNNGNGALKSNK